MLVVPPAAEKLYRAVSGPRFRPGRHSEVGYADAADAPNASDLFRVRLELRAPRARTNVVGTASVCFLARNFTVCRFQSHHPGS